MSTYEPTDLRGQERDQAERAKRDRQQREQEEADWKWLMAKPQGRRMVWRLLCDAKVFQSTFNTNALTMALGEGNRAYGLKVLTMIHAVCPELYPVMVKENTNVRSSGGGEQSN